MAEVSTRDGILRLFREHQDGYLSGEDICRELGVSRTAVWKQIRSLRDLGYRIEGVASQGYRLLEIPDRLLAEEIRQGLRTQRIGREVLSLKETGSTNSYLQDLAEKGAEEGLVVFADHQTGGRGRLGRSWASPEGVNLYLSVLLRPALSPMEVAQLTFVSAVAAAQALEDVCGVQPEVKWPNDLLLGGKKVAGLLNEMQAEVDQVHYLVLGIGVNLNMELEQFPPDLRYPATSVKLETGAVVNRTTYARSLLKALDRLYTQYLNQGAKPVLREWEKRCALIGQPVTVTGGTEARGVLVGIDEDGALLVENETGRQRVLSGDVRPQN